MDFEKNYNLNETNAMSNSEELSQSKYDLMSSIESWHLPEKVELIQDKETHENIIAFTHKKDKSGFGIVLGACFVFVALQIFIICDMYSVVVGDRTSIIANIMGLILVFVIISAIVMAAFVIISFLKSDSSEYFWLTAHEIIFNKNGGKPVKTGISFERNPMSTKVTIENRYRIHNNKYDSNVHCYEYILITNGVDKVIIDCNNSREATEKKELIEALISSQMY